MTLHGDLLQIVGIVVVRGIAAGLFIDPDGISTSAAFGTPFIRRRVSNWVYLSGNIAAQRKKGVKAHD